MNYWYEHPLPGCETRQGNGKEVNCWVGQSEGGELELEGCCWDKMLEEHFSENNKNHRWDFHWLLFWVKIGNCQHWSNIISKKINFFSEKFLLPITVLLAIVAYAVVAIIFYNNDDWLHFVDVWLSKCPYNHIFWNLMYLMLLMCHWTSRWKIYYVKKIHTNTNTIFQGRWNQLIWWSTNCNPFSTEEVEYVFMLWINVCSRSFFSSFHDKKEKNSKM